MTKYTPLTGDYILLPMTVYGTDTRPSLDAIATEFYGRKYVGQQTGDMMSNDSWHVFEMFEDEVEQWNADMEHARKRGHYLGLQRVEKGKGDNGGQFIHHYTEPGVSWFDYWKALKFEPSVYLLPDRSNMAEVLADRDPEEWEDARGHVFKFESSVYRKAPTPHYVLADLIKNKILPYGRYLVNVTW